jgi:tRNA(fMet)-specific endonuclease VapC
MRPARAHLPGVAGFQEEGKTIDAMDLIIAATAINWNYTLVTNNENHFRRIPGLKVEN